MFSFFFQLHAGLHLLNSGLAFGMFQLVHMLNGFQPFVCTRLPVDDHNRYVVFCMVYGAGAMKIHHVRFD